MLTRFMLREYQRTFQRLFIFLINVWIITKCAWLKRFHSGRWLTPFEAIITHIKLLSWKMHSCSVSGCIRTFILSLFCLNSTIIAKFFEYYMFYKIKFWRIPGVACSVLCFLTLQVSIRIKLSICCFKPVRLPGDVSLEFSRSSTNPHGNENPPWSILLLAAE